MVTKEQVVGLVMVLKAVAETVREAGEVPAGIVYAALMQQGCTLEQFNRICDQLAKCDLVKRTGDVLKWVGPAI